MAPRVQRERPGPADAVAVAATFVGARSADLVLVLADGALLADAAGAENGRVTPADVIGEDWIAPPQFSRPANLSQSVRNAWACVR